MANVIDKNKNDDQTRDLVNHRFRIASGAQSSNIQKWRNLIDMYDIGTKINLDRKRDERGEYSNSDQGLTNVSSSVLYNAVETVYPRLANLFDPEGWHTVVGRFGTRYESALNVQDIIQLELEDIPTGHLCINDILLKGLKQATKIGWFVGKLRWEVEMGKVYKRYAVTDARGEQKERFRSTKGKIFNGPVLDLIPYWSFYPDPKGSDIYSCKYVIEDAIMDIDDIEAFVDNGYFDKKALVDLKKLKKEGAWGDPVAENDRSYFNKDVYRHDVRVLIYQENKRYIYQAIPFGRNVADNQTVILNRSNQDNPYDHNEKQYIQFDINFDENSIFPKGNIEPLRDHQAIETTLLNMGLEALIKMIRPMSLFSDDLGIDIKELQNYIPGKPVMVDGIGMEDIRRKMLDLSPDPNVLNALGHIWGLLGSESQQISAQTDYVQGMAGVGSNKTARGVQQLTQNALSRDITPKAALAIGATRLLEMMHSMNQQYGDPADDIYGAYNFKVFEHAAVDRMVRLQTLKESLPVVAALGGNVQEVQKRIFRAGDVTAVEAILPEDGSMDENRANQARGQIVEMSMGQRQGGGGNV
jgi:hypothetical protein